MSILFAEESRTNSPGSDWLGLDRTEITTDTAIFPGELNNYFE
jgi:hypothetical protein